MKFKSPDGRVFDSLIKAVENYCNGKCADCKLCAFCTYPMEDWIANVERDYTYKICKIMGYEVIADKKACENCMFFEGDNTCNISGGKMRIAPVKICSMWEPKDELQQIRHIRNAPAADVVEVVRCKDCIWRGREECAMFYRCDCGEQHTWETDNDFCSYGERRNDHA